MRKVSPVKKNLNGYYVAGRLGKNEADLFNASRWACLKSRSHVFLFTAHKPTILLAPPFPL